MVCAENHHTITGVDDLTRLKFMCHFLLLLNLLVLFPFYARTQEHNKTVTTRARVCAITRAYTARKVEILVRLRLPPDRETL